MKIVKSLSIVTLAAYLVFQGLFHLAEMTSPIAHATIGLLGFISGSLILISLNHWIKE
jgi:hypothetical protein